MNLTEQIFCIGCGAQIQTENPNESGYLPSSALAKGMEQGEFYCQRCFRLRNYNELQDLNISDDIFLEKLSQIAEDKAFVILVVDIFDVEGSLITGLQRFIGKQPFIVAANKFDLLPKVTRKSKVKDWIRQIVNRYDLFPQDVILTSGMNQSGIQDLTDVIEKEIQNRNVYIVGVTNVGKSTLINQLLNYYGGDKEIITTSNHPGTTLDLIKIPLTEDYSIIDTPGIVKRSQLAHSLTRDEIETVIPTKPIRPKTFQLKTDQTIFLAGLARIDVVNSQQVSTALTFYVSQDLYLHRTKTEKADEFYHKHVGGLLTPPNEDSAEHFDTLVPRTYQFKDTQDISISGLGWLTANADCEIRIWTPKHISVSIRPSII